MMTEVHETNKPGLLLLLFWVKYVIIRSPRMQKAKKRKTTIGPHIQNPSLEGTDPNQAKKKKTKKHQK
jgi:hypothetical protein